MTILTSALQFIVESLFDFAITVLILRVILQYLRAPTRNPVILFIAKVTNPLVTPLQRVLPNMGRIDSAAVVWCVLFAMLESLIIFALFYGFAPPAFWLLAHSLGGVLNNLLHIYLFSIIILAVVSWVNPVSYNPVLDIMAAITAPLLIPAQRLIPPIGGLDLSPMVVIMLIMLLRIILVGPLLM